MDMRVKMMMRLNNHKNKRGGKLVSWDSNSRFSSINNTTKILKQKKACQKVINSRLQLLLSMANINVGGSSTNNEPPTTNGANHHRPETPQQQQQHPTNNNSTTSTLRLLAGSHMSNGSSNAAALATSTSSVLAAKKVRLLSITTRLFRIRSFPFNIR